MRFVARVQLPAGASEQDLRAELERLVQASRDLGVRAVEVDVERPTGRAVGIFVAARMEDVVLAHERAGIECGEVIAVERWWADLVQPPRT